MKYIELEGFKIEVEVLEERVVYGRTEKKITPVKGEGEKWVGIRKIKEDNKKAK